MKSSEAHPCVNPRRLSQFASSSSVSGEGKGVWPLGPSSKSQKVSDSHTNEVAVNTGLEVPCSQHVDFKVATLVHRPLSGISPAYIADDCRLVADARERRRRSTASRTCVVTRT